MKKGPDRKHESASALIEGRIRELGDWRGGLLSRIRALIKEAAPGVVEEWKWRGTPVWSLDGMICTGETYKDHVKMTFARGAALDDPAGLFTQDGTVRRAIDFHEGDVVKEEALKDLIRAAVALNRSSTRKPVRAAAAAGGRKRPGAVKPVLLAGGNPRIAKADGDAPVQAYIAAMPGWKRDVGRRIDGIITRNVPGVRKAVRWNSPFYGIEDRGWFLSFHTFANYVKLAFFRGQSLSPVPPGESKHKEVRYLDIHENDRLDERQLATWVRQAAALPGWTA